MGVHLELDHLVISTEVLKEGVECVERTLGVKLEPGGKHDNWGTHNALLGLGDVYLEVIAIDPDAPNPGRPRWFDLDNFKGAPRLTNWVARTTDIEGASALAPMGMAEIVQLSRGDLTWSMVAADQGKLPFDGGFPGLIQWDSTDHPAKRLADKGCRLSNFGIAHPQGDDLRRALALFGGDLDGSIASGDHKAMQAVIETPTGLKPLT